MMSKLMSNLVKKIRLLDDFGASFPGVHSDSGRWMTAVVGQFMDTWLVLRHLIQVEFPRGINEMPTSCLQESQCDWLSSALASAHCETERGSQCLRHCDTHYSHFDRARVKSRVDRPLRVL